MEAFRSTCLGFREAGGQQVPDSFLSPGTGGGFPETSAGREAGGGPAGLCHLRGRRARERENERAQGRKEDWRSSG